jgi:hypothetical protein
MLVYGGYGVSPVDDGLGHIVAHWARNHPRVCFKVPMLLVDTLLEAVARRSELVASPCRRGDANV